MSRSHCASRPRQIAFQSNRHHSRHFLFESSPHQRTEHFSPGPCTLIANGEKGEKGANITGSYTQPYIALYCLAKLAEGPTFGVLTGIDSQHVTQIPSIVIF